MTGRVFGGRRRMYHDVTTGCGRRLRYEVAGAPDGTPVFLLHGMPGSRVGPNPRLSVLYRQGIRLITYDRPGYGGSDRAPGRTVADGAADVATIADDLRLSTFAVAGRSAGGPHALACAALLPRRVTRVAVLVGLAPNDARDWYDGMSAANTEDFTAAAADHDKAAETLRARAIRTRQDPATLLASLWPDMAEPDRRVVGDPAIQRLLTRSYAMGCTEPDGWPDDVLALRRDWGFRPDQIHQPVRLWHGAADTFVPAHHARWLASRIPRASLEIYENAGHFGALAVLPSMLGWLVDPRPELVSVAEARR